jgi:hypothetical protein
MTFHKLERMKSHAFYLVNAKIRMPNKIIKLKGKEIEYEV